MIAVELDPQDRPPALARESALPHHESPGGTTERLLVSFGLLIALAFATLPVLGSTLALGTTFLAAPAVLVPMMRRHATPQLLTAAAALGLPVALIVLWLT